MKQAEDRGVKASYPSPAIIEAFVDEVKRIDAVPSGDEIIATLAHMLVLAVEDAEQRHGRKAWCRVGKHEVIVREVMAEDVQ